MLLADDDLRRKLLIEAAIRNNVDPKLAEAIWTAESSKSGDIGLRGPQTRYGTAIGPFQMLPETMQEMGVDPANATFGQQADAATKYMRQGIDKYGPEYAASYYYGGPDQSIWGPKTEAYQDKVNRLAGYASSNPQEPRKIAPPPIVPYTPQTSNTTPVEEEDGMIKGILSGLEDPITQLGLGILANNSGNYGQLGPALAGGLAQMTEAQKLQKERLEKEELEKAKLQVAGILSPEEQAMVKAYPSAASDIIGARYRAPNLPTSVEEYLYGQQNPGYNEWKKGQRSQGITIGPDGTVQIGGPQKMSTKTSGQLEKNIMGAVQSLSDLQRIGDQYASDFLTYQGAAKAKTGEVLSKWGLGDNEWSQFNAERQAFQDNVRQFFNAYRKEITGAAASVKELELLMESMFNADRDPVTFQRTYNEFVSKVKRNLELNQQMRRDGLPLNSPRNDAGQAVTQPVDPNTMSDDELFNELLK